MQDEAVDAVQLSSGGIGETVRWMSRLVTNSGKMKLQICETKKHLYEMKLQFCIVI